MAEIRVNVTASKSQRVNVSSSNIATEITATPDTSQYYSNLSKNWAIAENIVDGKDYSSKHYAKEAQQASALANTYKEATEQAYISFSEQYANAETELTSIKDASVQEINTAVTDGKTEITTTKDLAIDAVNNTKTTILQDIEFVADGEKQEIEDLIDNGKEELKESIGDVKVLTTLGIGDIGFTQMAIDESKGKRRVLNGQVIIQDQYVQFTNIVKNSVALNSDLTCTEAEWQTAITMSEAGICDKFVIDDEAGTIRLPKYPEYFIGGGIASVAGNGKALGVTNGNITGALYSQYSYANATQYIAPNINTSSFDLGVDSNNINTLNNQSTIGVTTDATKSGIEAHLNDAELVKGTYFIQVATGAEIEDNIVNEIELNNPFSLLDYKYSEYELNNISWLRSNGQYNSKAVYPAVYDLLLKIYNGTETKAGVSVKLHTEEYTDEDFVINQDDETFRLQLKVKLASGKAVVGNGMSLGLTNGDLNLALGSGHGTSGYAVAGQPGYGNPVGTVTSAGGATNSKSMGVTTDSTKSGIETSDSDLYLYFYVGETVQNANLINAGRIEEKLTNFLSKGNKEEIISWGLPDYSAGVTITFPYVAPTIGWVLVRKDRSNDSKVIYINGVLVDETFGTTNGLITISAFVDRGDTVTVSGSSSSTNFFFPLKGAN